MPTKRVLGPNEAAAKVDRKTALEVLRDTLAYELDTTDKGIHAQIAAQYRATLVELDEINGVKLEEKPKAGIDELKRRRAAGRKSATNAPTGS